MGDLKSLASIQTDRQMKKSIDTLNTMLKTWLQLQKWLILSEKTIYNSIKLKYLV